MKIFKTLFFLLMCTAAFAQKNALPDGVVASIKSRIDFGLMPSIVIGIIDKDDTHYYSFGTKTVGGEPTTVAGAPHLAEPKCLLLQPHVYPTKFQWRI